MQSQAMKAGYASIAAMLKVRSGLTLGPDKLYLMQTRLSGLMRREDIRDLSALAARAQPGSMLEREIIEAMTTNETLFFRDTKPFEVLGSHVLPRLHAARPTGTRLRIWSAAAATGQEAYSIAMVVAERAPLLGERPVEILGTDIARDALKRAREGVYSRFEMQRGLPMRMLARHFVKQDQHWCVEPALRAAVDFREWNLLSDLRPLGRFDVVFCRNVLIYFDAPTKARVLAAIAGQMSPDGVLFLGSAETNPGLTAWLQNMPDEPGAFGRLPSTTHGRVVSAG